MLKFINGPVGSGKTQKLIDQANNELENTKGLIVYIDKSDKHRFDISSSIRFVDAKSFGVATADELASFVCGLIAGNYDINRIFIDNVDDIAALNDAAAFGLFFDRMSAIANTNDVQITVSVDDEAVAGIDLESYTK